MNSERLIRIIAGTFIIGTLIAAQQTNNIPVIDTPNWLWLTAFVGVNLLQSGFTRWCLMEKMLRAVGVKSGCVSASDKV